MGIEAIKRRIQKKKFVIIGIAISALSLTAIIYYAPFLWYNLNLNMNSFLINGRISGLKAPGSDSPWFTYAVFRIECPHPVDIRYTDPEGHTVYIENAKCPWTKSVLTGDGTFYTLDAQNQGEDGLIIASVIVYGKVINSAMSKGKNAYVRCYGYISHP